MKTSAYGLRQDEEVAFRRQFERDGIWSRMVAPGDRLPELPLVEVDLGPIRMDRMRRIGPIVLVFFRYASSPEGNAMLRAYAKDLGPALDGLGAHLVAVSPQMPDRLRSVKRRHNLDFFVASDPRHALIDAFNLGFERPGTEALLGTRDPVLPLPAAVVADRAGTVRFVDVPADSARRTPAAALVDAVRRLG
jgi:peroxiredoxin